MHHGWGHEMHDRVANVRHCVSCSPRWTGDWRASHARFRKPIIVQYRPRLRFNLDFVPIIISSHPHSMIRPQHGGGGQTPTSVTMQPFVQPQATLQDMAQFRLGEAALQIVCPACHENVVGGMFLMRRHGAAEPEDLQAGRHMPIVMQPMGCMPLVRARQDPQELPTCSGGVQKNVAENTDTVVADGTVAAAAAVVASMLQSLQLVLNL